MKYTTTIVQIGNNTGIAVPAEVVTALGAGKKPPVTVTLNGYTYRSSIATVDGTSMISLSAANRTAAGVDGGYTLEVDVQIDTAPRVIEVPPVLAEALA